MVLKNLGFGRPDIPKRHGTAISMAQLEHLLDLEPRRHRLKDPSWHNLSWSALREPYDQSTDWSVNFPFFETYGPAFDEYCRSVADSAPIDRTPFERNDGSCVKYTFLKNTSQEQLDDIGAWIDLVGQYVGIRDFLRVSFALDYTCEAGNPDNSLTKIARLRQEAKLYGAKDSPSTETLAAASRLAVACVKIIDQSKSYLRANAVIAVPRSDPSKKYSLPAFIAERIAQDLSLADLSECVKTTTARQEMKDTPAAKRLSALEGTIEVLDAEAVKGKGILIVDDLYQSGITMNYVGMLLLEAGASCVYGLACEKTCSNQD